MEDQKLSIEDQLELESMEERIESPRSVRRIIKGLLTNPTSLLGTVILIAFAFVALLAPVLAPCPDDPRQARRCNPEFGGNPYNVPRFGYGAQPQAPSFEEGLYFGTTPSQYDIFYAVVWGSRTAFKVGIIIVFFALLIGLTIGSISAYYGGWIDEVLMRIVEIFQAFPFLLAAITLATVLKAIGVIGPWEVLGFEFGGWRIEGIYPAMLALIGFSWTGYARLVRADILSVKQREYVWASKSLGR